MNLHTDWRSIPKHARGCVLALGNFDGVHLGHAHLLHAAHTARPDAPRAVVTFEPHPRSVFRPDDPPFRLTPSPVRAALLEALGVRHVFEIRFDEAFSEMTAEAFVTEVLHEALGGVHLACGLDFAFGHRRGGNAAFLEARAEALGIGLTLELLGRDWAVTGTVVHGDQRGRTIGFPTANIALGEHLEPARGVYAVLATLPDGRVIPGLANVGRRPTVAEGAISRLEAHLFDFAEDLYGQVLSVALHRFIRAERKFDSFDALRAQIVADAAHARGLLDPWGGLSA